jgi:hypothetical protein
MSDSCLPAFLRFLIKKHSVASLAICALAIISSSCSPHSTAVATIELALVPEDVTAIVLWVRDGDETVASATVAPDVTSVDLGVPAERQLEFSVLARTAQPGPQKLGGLMPGWVGRVVKRIPLGREQTVLPITAHPAGALTLLPKLSMVGRSVRVRLAAESGEPPLELELTHDVERVLALRTGRYRVTVAEEDEADAQIAAGDGVFVARRTESVGIVEVEPLAPIPPPEAVRRLELALADAAGNRIDPPILTSTAGVTIRVLVEGIATDGMRVESEADVTIVVESSPARLTGPRRFTAEALPAITPPIEIRGGIGRVAISGTAILGDERRELHHELRTNVRPLELEIGPPVRLDLALLGDATDLIRGTRLSAELIDQRGLFAEEADGTMDFGDSDPWLFFPGGPGAEVTPDDEGHLIREVARPSGPRGLFVVLRASFTSTATPGPLTASVTLPVLELSK